METILDGKGRGYVLEVNKDNQIEVNASSKPRSTYISDTKGDSLRVLSGFVTVTTTNGCMLYFKNTSQTQHFHVNRVFIGWDGGSTTFNKPMFVDFNVGTSEPSANRTSVTPAVANSRFQKSYSVTSWSWDEVSTGMTVASAGTSHANPIVKQGYTILVPDGNIILGTNGSVGIFAKGIEIGEASFTIEGYFEDN